ncbi:ABC transporter ATP-binding protein [Clostridium sporogenes]|uniref:ABC transporter ATP-binding protein n=1 Tax=Clostridium botulinum TaxID=1491 RepID=A0A6M0SVQ2_CLOBO|nr:ABC transporter ATP-binding protein [Clostridium sporogenes]NFA59607.1 ABC transporter ATP-binding protein [Clostridium botulinum]NFI73379.1 ABC transporter ATP-binding protein [Clostridium sporogenes]NFL72672.1 ABC transporter ATP-binding protein [Clostridium sporogenes]NFM23238.1 ABC transporter ATP-binding protein [Clostridium sporogenes]NFP61373.1 ABC transporter ATP-binding protein [Clostridium sporogenes]
MSILKAIDIKKKINIGNNSYDILKGINLEINEGEFLSIMGQSGAGKSTLLYILSALDTPSEGRVLFDNNDIFSMKDSKVSKLRRENFGFIFQFYNLIEGLNIEDNISIIFEYEGVPKKKYKEKLEFLLNKVGLYEKRKYYPYQLSGGQQQRVSIARALITDPKIIFADEPTGSLDSNSGNNVLEILKSLNVNDKKTIVMVTHDKHAASFSNRIIEIKDGNIDLSNR